MSQHVWSSCLREHKSSLLIHDSDTKPTASTISDASSAPFRNIRDLPASKELIASEETFVDPGAQVTGRNGVNLVWTFVADQ